MSFLSDWSNWAPDLLSGLWVSIKLTAGSLALGFPLGLLLALGSSSKRLLLQSVSIVLTEVGRGTPALVMLQVIYFGLPAHGITTSAFLSVVVAFALTTGAYSSEIIRGGLQSVPRGEVEAAEALAMPQIDILRYILIPQGLRVAMPALMGFSILMFQTSSLAFSIALPELMSKAYAIGSSSFKYLSVLTAAGVLYAVITIPASWLVRRAESQLSRHA